MQILIIVVTYLICTSAVMFIFTKDILKAVIKPEETPLILNKEQ